MVRFSFFICSLILLSTASNAAPFSLRGYNLGMTIDAFKAMPHPEAGNYPGEKIYILCTGDKGATSTLAVSEANAKLGFIYCKHFLKKTTSIGESYEEVKLTFNTIGLSPKFVFTPAPDKGSLRLAYIFIDSEMRHWDKLYAAFRSEYGNPSDIANEKIKTGGVTYDKIIAAWKNPDGFLFLEQRTDDQLDLVTIDYTHKALGDFTIERRKALPNNSSK